MYGIMCSAIMLWAIATFIEACRSRPKDEMIVLGFKRNGELAGKEKEVKQPAKPDES